MQALFQPETELLALELLGGISEQIARSDAAAHRANNAAGLDAAGAGADLFSCLSLADGLLLGAAGGTGCAAAPIEAVLGDLEAGTAISLGAALPWLCVHLREVGHEGVVESYLESTAGACAALGWGDLAAALGALSGMAGAAEEPEHWLPPLCTVSPAPAAPLLPVIRAARRDGLEAVRHRSAVCMHQQKQVPLFPCAVRYLQALCSALFPAHSRLVLQRLMEAVQRGAERYQAAAIACMRAIFQASASRNAPAGHAWTRRGAAGGVPGWRPVGSCCVLGSAANVGACKCALQRGTMQHGQSAPQSGIACPSMQEHFSPEAL